MSQCLQYVAAEHIPAQRTEVSWQHDTYLREPLELGSCNRSDSK
jgi:hypothetical protein